MCGIIAYIGKKPVDKILINGLKRMEYRGYDSAGICLAEENNLINIKKKGEVNLLEKTVKAYDLKNKNINLGIAHTRWATHGSPNKINAHPHLDLKQEIAIVHNGIIENYDSLKKILKKDGVIMKSETDSEVLAHLIAKFYSGNLKKAVLEALNLIEGSYGLAIIDNKANKIIAVRNSSPLVVGVGKKETYIASDPLALINETKKIIYLKDKEIVEINENGFKIEDYSGKKVDYKIIELKNKVEEIEKGSYKHFMLKEIFDQPKSIRNLLAGRLKNNKIKLSLNLKNKSYKRIILSACGTSWHSCLIGKYFIEKYANIPVEVDYASEFRYRNPLTNKEDLFIAISQSGETADTLAALREVKLRGLETMAIVNVVGSTISREVDSGIYLHAGPEIGVASTKAFSSQVLALLLFALYLKQEKGEKINKIIINEIKKVPSLIEETLKNNNEVKKVANKYYQASNFLYLGRGINFPVALEGALKLKEISYIHAEGYPAAEIKHGPIALIDKKMPSLFLATKDDLIDKLISNMQEIKARGGKIIAITNNKNKQIKKLANHIILVPKTIPELASIINSIPLQLLAYYIADKKSLNVDKPRNLAKSVTVE